MADTSRDAAPGGARPPTPARRLRLLRWLREPLVLFLTIGLAIFALEHAVRSAREARDVHLPADEVTRLLRAWEAQAGRPAGEEERAMLVAERVREEILYREALRLGLDEGDVIVRRRLAQKMSFVLADRTSVREPDEEEVRRYFEEHAERYVEPLRLSFQHVFFSPEGRGREEAEAEARAALATLVERTEAADDGAWRRLGDPFMLQREYGARPLSEVAALFGRGFAELLGEAPLARWSGPLESPYGVHLVRVVGRSAARQPELAEVRGRVLEDLRAARRLAANEEAFAELRRRYRVSVESPAEDDSTDRAALIQPDG